MIRFLRKFGTFSALVLAATGLASGAAVLWPKPAAVTLAGLTLLATFGGLIAFCMATSWGFAGQVRRLIIFV